VSYVDSTVKLHSLAAWLLQLHAEPVQQLGTATPGPNSDHSNHHRMSPNNVDPTPPFAWHRESSYAGP
jgi:hypothetical protein